MKGKTNLSSFLLAEVPYEWPTGEYERFRYELLMYRELDIDVLWSFPLRPSAREGCRSTILSVMSNKSLTRTRAAKGKWVPSPGEAKRGEEGHIGYLLRQAGAAYRLRLERKLSSLTVTPPQFAVLTMLKAYPGASNADIARVALLTPPTMTVIVQNLLRRGLVRRTAHAEHGRIHQLHLTTEGIQLLAQCRRLAVEIENDLLDGLTAKEQSTIKKWLVRTALDSDAT